MYIVAKYYLISKNNRNWLVFFNLILNILQQISLSMWHVDSSRPLCIQNIEKNSLVAWLHQDILYKILNIFLSINPRHVGKNSFVMPRKILNGSIKNQLTIKQIKIECINQIIAHIGYFSIDVYVIFDHFLFGSNGDDIRGRIFLIFCHIHWVSKLILKHVLLFILKIWKIIKVILLGCKQSVDLWFTNLFSSSNNFTIE